MAKLRLRERAMRFLGVPRLLERSLMESQDEVSFLRESLSRLELEIENEGYYRLTQLAEYQFDRKRLGDIIKLAVQMAIKNPITNRTVTVKADYVFGQGVRFVAKHPLVQQVVDEWKDYLENRKVLTSHTAMLRRERDKQVYGNLFFALFTNRSTGRVTVRVFDVLDIPDIIRDPEDYEKELFIKRIIPNGSAGQRVVYYPALGITREAYPAPPWSYQPDSGATDEGPVMWDTPVLHVATNRYGKEKFGMPDVYPQLDWALAYKRFLEDWTSIIRAFARMAFKISGLSGKKQAAAAKSLLGTSVNLSQPIEKNPSATAGSIPLLGKGVDIEAVKTSGATTPASDGGPVLNMACAAVGLPNTFYGDASIGNYATAQTLDRPTELGIISEQRMWEGVFSTILGYVIQQSAECESGILGQAGASVSVDTCPFSGKPVTVTQMPVNEDPQCGEVGKPISTMVEVIFPEILERNVTDRVRALVNAATLFGKQLTDIIPDKRLVARLLLQALNVPNVESYLPEFIRMWEANMKAEDGKPVDAITIPPSAPPQPGFGAEDPSQGGAVGSNG